MIGALGAVDARGAAELGGDHHDRIAPALAQSAFEFSERAVEAGQQLRQTADRATFIGVGIPAVERQRCDPRAVVISHQFGGAARHQPHRARIVGARLRLHVVALRGLFELQPLRQRRRQRRIAMIVELDQAHRGIVIGLRQRDRRPADGRRRPTQHQRRGRTDREAAHHPLAFGQGFQRAVEPAGLHPARTGKAAFEHVLSVEMRAVTIRRRHRMDHRGLLVFIHPREFRHRRMQREE